MDGISLLLDIGVDPSQPAPEGSTALDSARSLKVICLCLSKALLTCLLKRTSAVIRPNLSARALRSTFHRHLLLL